MSDGYSFAFVGAAAYAVSRASGNPPALRLTLTAHADSKAVGASGGPLGAWASPSPASS